MEPPFPRADGTDAETGVGARTASDARIEDAHGLPPLADRYELIEPIARGGVAWVWRAHDRVLDRPVAVKVLRADADPVFASRFTTEAQTAARIRHPGVVAIYDAGVHDGLPFLAMELLDGETLRQRLRRDGALDPAAVRRLGRSLAAALDAIRRAGLVHGDLKPENVILGADDEPTIMDLGLARAVWEQGTDHADGVWGTPGYLAPERRRGEPGDHRSDVYALGAMLFEAATGEAPPADGSPRWASLVDPRIPEELAAAIARATLPDPDERYPTAAAFGMQLAGEATASVTRDTIAIDATDRETVMLKPPPPIARAQRSRRRRWLIAALATVLALVAGFVLLRPMARVTVPSVEGLAQERAEEELRAVGLEPLVTTTYDGSVAAGRVISQEPADGISIREGDAVQLVVSLGPQLVRIPEVEGMTPAEAVEELERAGFTTIERERVFDDEVGEGLAVGTRPSGRFAEAEEPITLLISDGPDLVQIPSVAGETKDDAVAILRGADFRVVLRFEFDRDVEDGFAIGTDPGEGAEVSRGSRVTLVVSKGPPLADVPNVGCMTKGQAKDAIKAAGFEASFEGNGSRVVDQQPGPNERAPEGSTVTAYMGFGVFC